MVPLMSTAGRPDGRSDFDARQRASGRSMRNAAVSALCVTLAVTRVYQAYFTLESTKPLVCIGLAARTIVV